MILSDPAAATESPSFGQHRALPGVALSVASPATEQSGDIAYISLAPGTYPDGRFVRIHTPRLTGAVIAPMVEGGLDPVPIPAQAGDSVEIEILSPDGLTLAVSGSKAPERRRPRVVRTIPPRGKTDVAVNAIIVVVFSEPIATSSLSSSALQLLNGTAPVPGTARILEGVTATVVFESSTPLDANTVYRLVVTQEVRDLEGEPLEEAVSIEFTTGSSFAPVVQLVMVEPSMALLRTGSRLQLVANTFGLDTTAATFTMVPIAGIPLLWASDDPTVATVSSTGLVTGLKSGLVGISAYAPGNVGGQATLQVSSSAAEVASLELSPGAASTPVTGKVELTATTRSSAGEVLLYRPVMWSSSDTAIATVASSSLGRAWVTGVSSGRASIIATSEDKSDTVTIDVINPGPYVVLSAGSSTTCGRREGGWAFCWGENLTGQVGDGTHGSSALPRPVSRGLRFAHISTDGPTSCGVDIDGAAFCWGSNASGALGIGSAAGPEFCEGGGPCSRIPVAVRGGLKFVRLDLGAYDRPFVCGLATNGGVYCWGNGRGGQLGVGSTAGLQECEASFDDSNSCTSPVAIEGERSYTSVTSGGLHACALAISGAAYCWGDNSVGQLGDGTAIDRATPVPVADGHTFAALSAGMGHTCGLTTEGNAYCWGANWTGQLGHGAFTGPESCLYPCSTIPVRVNSTLVWSAISGGLSHTCALTPGGAAYCWGSNEQGALGNGSIENTAWPVAVAGGLTFANLTAGSLHSCGVTTDGTAYCWGDNTNLALGTDDALPNSRVPVRVEGQP